MIDNYTEQRSNGDEESGNAETHFDLFTTIHYYNRVQLRIPVTPGTTRGHGGTTESRDHVTALRRVTERVRVHDHAISLLILPIQHLAPLIVFPFYNYSVCNS